MKNFISIAGISLVTTFFLLQFGAVNIFAKGGESSGVFITGNGFTTKAVAKKMNEECDASKAFAVVGNQYYCISK